MPAKWRTSNRLALVLSLVAMAMAVSATGVATLWYSQRPRPIDIAEIDVSLHLPEESAISYSAQARKLVFLHRGVMYGIDLNADAKSNGPVFSATRELANHDSDGVVCIPTRTYASLWNTSKNEILIIDLVSLALVKSLQTSWPPNAVTATWDGRFLAAKLKDLDVIQVWDLTDGTSLHFDLNLGVVVNAPREARQARPDWQHWYQPIAANDRVIAVRVQESNSILLFDPGSKKTVGNVPLPNTHVPFALSPSSLFFCAEGDLFRCALNNLTVLPVGTTPSGARSICYSGSTDSVAIATAPAIAFALSPRLALTNDTGTAIRRRIRSPSSHIYWVSWCPEHDLLLTYGMHKLCVWKMKDVR